MATVSTSNLFGPDGNFKVFVAGVVMDRPKAPATKAIPMRSFRMPGMPKIESGLKAPATKPTYGHVRISKYPKHMAGMDPAGFMT
jgi:hypothetical protein